MTRAKLNLVIHLNGNYLDRINVDNLVKIENHESHDAPNELVERLSFKDIWLDYFIKRQTIIDHLKSGDSLRVNNEECFNAKGQSVLKFSKQFATRIAAMKAKNYQLTSVKVHAIVYWTKEDTSIEVKIILPEVKFEKVVN